jgi:outer membrane receptor for ferrienterochelin and colicin
VLLDGRRVIGGDAVGVVDVNIIPAAIIENIEIITGGASGRLRFGRHRRRGELPPAR